MWFSMVLNNEKKKKLSLTLKFLYISISATNVPVQLINQLLKTL